MLGKPAGGDLRQGNITLPVFYAMQDEQLKKQIESVHEDMKEEDLCSIIEQIKRSGAIEKSIEISDRYLQKAHEQLEGLPNIKAKKSLNDIAQHMIVLDGHLLHTPLYPVTLPKHHNMSVLVAHMSQQELLPVYQWTVFRYDQI